MNESWNYQGHLTDYRMDSTRHIFFCISPTFWGLTFLGGSNIKGSTWNQDKIYNYTLLCIKCPLPDKLSAAYVLPDNPKSRPCRHYGRIGPEHILKVPHASKFKWTCISHKVQKGPYQTYSPLHKPRQTPKKGSQNLGWIKHRRYHMKSIYNEQSHSTNYKMSNVRQIFCWKCTARHPHADIRVELGRNTY